MADRIEIDEAELVDLALQLGNIDSPPGGRVARRAHDHDALAVGEVDGVRHLHQHVEVELLEEGYDASILFKTILPNCLAPVLVHTTLGIANAILSESYVSFLGLGVPPPTATWGNM